MILGRGAAGVEVWEIGGDSLTTAADKPYP